MDAQHIRTASMEAARLLGIYVDTTLPFFTKPLRLRTLEEIVARLLAMHAVAASASGVTRSRALRWLEREYLAHFLTKEEARYMYEYVGPVDKFQWQVEGMWALAWALGIVKDLDFGKDCSSHFAAMLPNLTEMESANRFRARVSVRDLDEIIAMRELAYCLHSGMRTIAQYGERPPRRLKSYVVVERRRALEWLLSDEGWNEVKLDTWERPSQPPTIPAFKSASTGLSPSQIRNNAR